MTPEEREAWTNLVRWLEAEGTLIWTNDKVEGLVPHAISPILLSAIRKVGDGRRKQHQTSTSTTSVLPSFQT